MWLGINVTPRAHIETTWIGIDRKTNDEQRPIIHDLINFSEIAMPFTLEFEEHWTTPVSFPVPDVHPANGRVVLQHPPPKPVRKCTIVEPLARKLFMELHRRWHVHFEGMAQEFKSDPCMHIHIGNLTKEEISGLTRVVCNRIFLRDVRRQNVDLFSVTVPLSASQKSAALSVAEAKKEVKFISTPQSISSSHSSMPPPLPKLPPPPPPSPAAMRPMQLVQVPQNNYPSYQPPPQSVYQQPQQPFSSVQSFLPPWMSSQSSSSSNFNPLEPDKYSSLPPAPFVPDGFTSNASNQPLPSRAVVPTWAMLPSSSLDYSGPGKF